MKARGPTVCRMDMVPKHMQMEEVTKANGYAVCDMATVYGHRLHLEWLRVFERNQYEHL
ncbi:hypothetical protein RP20_CCG010269 [Aedes albopictus]|nr:hypothetical protein RP20_CCG023665 [Aedes albopictus]KXJ76138.1 hypothetical protein RP20_CCG010269 [Aedes albopictus]